MGILRLGNLYRLAGHPCHSSEILNPLLEPVGDVPIVDHVADVDEGPDVHAEGVLAVHVLLDALVPAVCYGGPVLLGAHAVDLRYRAQQAHALRERRENKLHAQLLLVQERPAPGLVLRDEALEHPVEVRVEVVVLATIEPPPELPAHGIAPRPAPIEDTDVQRLLGIAPEEDIVHVEVAVAPRDVVLIAVAPVGYLRRIRVHGCQDLLVGPDEIGGGAMGGEDCLGRLRDEVRPHLDLRLELAVAQACVVRPHAPHLGPPPLRAVPELVQLFEGRQPLSLVGAGHLRAHLDQQVVVLLRRPLQLPVLHLVVGGIKLPVPDLLAKGDALGDLDPVGGLVADVAVVVLGDGEGQAGLQQPRGVDLHDVAALLHH
mmetsp:Transcript_3942/g.10856  ORF Transcript_3942/g.10856 Transcript_3942/m.10856 type:complete len:373 (-) Transcript_3942:751-1869(-)